MKIGFIGLGQMGSGMAANLLKAGHELTVFNRSPGKAAPLVAQGATLAPALAAFAEAEVVFTMLAHDQALEEVVFHDGLLAHLPEGATHVSCSTISVQLAERLTAAHAEARQQFVSAPVFGRPTAAADAKLFIVAAGLPDVVKAVAPLFDAVGQKTFVLSEHPKDANVVKLSGNFLIAAVIESLGEALALVGKAGIDKQHYLDIMTSTLFGAPIYKTYGALIVDEKFEPAGFAAPLGQKDIRLTLSAAEDLRVTMPLASLLRDRFITLLAHGGDKLDWSAIGGLAAKDAAV